MPGGTPWHRTNPAIAVDSRRALLAREALIGSRFQLNPAGDLWPGTAEDMERSRRNPSEGLNHAETPERSRVIPDSRPGVGHAGRRSDPSSVKEVAG